MAIRGMLTGVIAKEGWNWCGNGKGVTKKGATEKM